jgi:hypothetical protein
MHRAILPPFASHRGDSRNKLRMIGREALNPK